MVSFVCGALLALQQWDPFCLALKSLLWYLDCRLLMAWLDGDALGMVFLLRTAGRALEDAPTPSFERSVGELKGCVFQKQA